MIDAIKRELQIAAKAVFNRDGPHSAKGVAIFAATSAYLYGSALHDGWGMSMAAVVAAPALAFTYISCILYYAERKLDLDVEEQELLIRPGIFVERPKVDLTMK